MPIEANVIISTEKSSAIYCLRLYLEELLAEYEINHPITEEAFRNEVNISITEKWMVKLKALLKEFIEDCAFLEEDIINYFNDPTLFSSFKDAYKLKYARAVK